MEHPNVCKQTYNTSTSSIRHIKEEHEGRQEKKTDAKTMKLDTRCMTKEENRCNIYQFGALLCSCHPCESKEKKKKVIKALFTDNFHKESALKERTRTPNQCHNSTHLAQLLPIPARLLFGSSARVSGRSRGGGVGSAIYLHHCRGQRSP